jgi:DNA-binding MarR family transcriptional regulator
MSLPSTFSDLDDALASEVASFVERAAAEASSETLEGLTDLLLDRALRLLREGSRQEILAEALALSCGVSGEPGHALQQRSPETFGAWSTLDDLLAEAARRSDRAAVPALLRGTQGHGMAILELLAGERRAVPRAELRRRLGLGEAHLSHLLRDLEEADLIVRYRPQQGKEVLVELGLAGREVVAQSVLPPWLERLERALTEVAGGGPLDSEALARELKEAGAPSHLAAGRLAEAVVRMVSAEPQFSRRKKQASGKQRDWHRLTGFFNGIEAHTGKYLFSPNAANTYLDLVQKDRQNTRTTRTN